MEKNSLTTAEYMDYLRKVKDLELSCYQLTQLHRKLTQEYKNTQANINRLSVTLNRPPKFGLLSLIAGILRCAPLAFIIGAGPGIVVGIFTWCGNMKQSFFGVIISKILLFSTILLGVFFVIWTCSELIGSIGYSKRLAEYEKKEKSRLNALHREEQRLPIISAEIKKCTSTSAKTKDVLGKYYSLGYIYPKYRDLVAVCTIYEYLESGRCFSLIGHDGAYNLYESELRMNLIIGKLDDVIDRLDEISANQRILANEIRNSNWKIDNISRTLSNIESNTALTQYYSSITAANTDYLTWLAIWNQI